MTYIRVVQAGKQRLSALFAHRQPEPLPEPMAESVKNMQYPVDAWVILPLYVHHVARFQPEPIAEIDRDLAVIDKEKIAVKFIAGKHRQPVLPDFCDVRTRLGGHTRLFFHKYFELCRGHIGDDIKIQIGLSALKQIAGNSEEIMRHGERHKIPFGQSVVFEDGLQLMPIWLPSLESESGETVELYSYTSRTLNPLPSL